MSKDNDVLRHLQIIATGEEPGGDLTFDGATGKLSVMRVCPLDTAGNTRITDRKQDLQTLLECSICLETFEEPRTLPCLHSFCKKCLENFVDGKCDDELNCPVCRSKFTLNKEEGVAGMTRNHFICNMIEVLSFQHQDKCIPCSHCEQPSVGRCVKCELFMCEKCLQSHNGYVGFRDHVVLTMEELSKPENQSKIKKTSKCTKHPRKKLKYYCETCDELICRHCMDFDHDKQHKFSPLEQAAQNKRKDLKTNSEILERTVADGNRKAQVLKEDRRLLNSNYERAKHVINERKEQLLDRLQKRLQEKTDSMIENARQVFDRKTGNVKKKINETETFVNRVKASADMARSLLENGNDEEIVRSCQSIQENVDSPKGEVHDDLHDDVGVLPWNSGEIDKMLLAEITDIVEDTENVDSPKGEVHDDLHDDVGVLPWNSGEIDKMLLAEITDIVEDTENVDSPKGEVHDDLHDDVGVLPWNSGEIDKMLLAEITDIFEDIEDEAEVECFEKMPYYQASQLSEKKKKGEKGRGKPTKGETRKKEDHPTLQNQALADKEAHQQQGDQFHPLREAKPQEKGVTKPRMDDESLGRRHQQRSERKHEEKGNQIQRRDNNENQSPNTGSTPPRGVGSQSPPTSPLTSQMNTPQHPGTTQSWGLGAQKSVPPITSAPTSFRQVYDASLHYGTAQGGHYGTQGQGNFPQPTYSPSSQYPQTRGRGPQRNISPYSSSQNPQHPHYAQEGSERSAKDRDRSQRNMQSQQPYASPCSSQALAKHRGSALPIGSTTATGHF